MNRSLKGISSPIHLPQLQVMETPHTAVSHLQGNVEHKPISMPKKYCCVSGAEFC
jgi:hypothetical protein